jgi:hypothetical protein
MSISSEEINKAQYITNKAGIQTAIIVPLENEEEDFRRLLTEFVESRNFKSVASLISLEQTINTLEILVKSTKDINLLEEIVNEIENLKEAIDDRLDSIVIAERAGEETISHEDVREQLKADGLI